MDIEFLFFFLKQMRSRGNKRETWASAGRICMPVCSRYPAQSPSANTSCTDGTRNHSLIPILYIYIQKEQIKWWEQDNTDESFLRINNSLIFFSCYFTNLPWDLGRSSLFTNSDGPTPVDHTSRPYGISVPSFSSIFSSCTSWTIPFTILTPLCNS